MINIIFIFLFFILVIAIFPIFFPIFFYFMSKCLNLIIILKNILKQKRVKIFNKKLA